MIDGVTAVVDKLRAKLPKMEILLLDIFPRGQRINAQRGKILQANQVLSRLDARPAVDNPLVIGGWPWYIGNVMVIGWALMLVAALPMRWLRRRNAR